MQDDINDLLAVVEEEDFDAMPQLPVAAPAPPAPAVMGFFAYNITANGRAMFKDKCSTIANKVLTSLQSGRPFEICEWLNRTAIANSNSEFKKQATKVKPYFDFDHTLEQLTRPSAEVITSTVTGWELEVLALMHRYLPRECMEVKVATRHRPVTGGYKLSARFFVTGVWTTLEHMDVICRKHKAAHPDSAMDGSVYSSNRKMSMVFCVKSSTKAEDNVPLLPGYTYDPSFPWMQSPTFCPLDYVIQYVTPTYIHLCEQPTIPSVVASHNKRAAEGPAGGDELSSKRHSDMMYEISKPILVELGFVNPKQTGSTANTKYGKAFDFTADNREDCPLCHGQHANNMWFCSIGGEFVVSNHSDTCRPEGVRHDVSYIRPMSDLMRALTVLGPNRHADYAIAYHAYIGDAVRYDQEQGEFLTYSEQGKWEVINDAKVQSSIMEYITGLLQGEVAKGEGLVRMVKRIGTCNNSVAKLEDQVKQAKLGTINIGKNDFQRSVLAQLKVCLSQDSQITYDANPDVVHFTDGVLHLDTGVFRPSNPADYNKFTTGYRYAENATGPLGVATISKEEADAEIVKCISTILPFEDKREVFQAFLGAILSGRTDAKKVFAMCDMKDGHNGKSFLMQMATKMMGDYALKAPRNAINMNKMASAENASPFLMSLKGKRMLFSEELGDRSLDTAFLKELTSGYTGIKMTGRQLYGKVTSFVLQAKVVMTANRGKLMFDTSDEAFKKRLLCVPFEVTFVSDPSLVKAPYYMPEEADECDRMLTSPAHHAALFRWAYEGYRRFVASKNIFDDEHLPDSMVTFKREVVLYNDPAMTVLHDVIFFSDIATDFLDPQDIYRTFRQNRNVKTNIKEKDFMKSLKLFVCSSKADAWVVHGNGRCSVKYYKFRYA